MNTRKNERKEEQKTKKNSQKVTETTKMGVRGGLYFDQSINQYFEKRILEV